MDDKHYIIDLLENKAFGSFVEEYTVERALKMIYNEDLDNQKVIDELKAIQSFKRFVDAKISEYDIINEKDKEN